MSPFPDNPPTCMVVYSLIYEGGVVAPLSLVEPFWSLKAEVCIWLMKLDNIAHLYYFGL